MKQHPVPQNISSYQFRLVGNMTLKQFLELAAGLVIAYLLFHLNISAFIKWPLIGFFSFLGFALAFLPIEGRPLEKWIINFIKSVYSPTRFLWQKNNQPPDFLLAKASLFPKARLKKSFKRDESALKEYLQTFSSPAAATLSGPIDQKEKKQLDSIGQLLTSSPSLSPQKPSTKALSRAAIKQNGDKTQQAVIKQSPPVKPQPMPIAVVSSPPTGPALTKQPIQKPIVAPAPPLTPPISVESVFKFDEKIKPEMAAMFPNQIPMPAPSEAPNVLVGMILTPDEKILPNTIIEIKDSKNNTIRALKANKLGQFFTAAPLEKGDYKIKAEHEGYEFDLVNLKTEGKIIPPVRIKAKKTISNN